MSKELTPMQELRKYLDTKIDNMIKSNSEYYRNIIQELEEVDNKCIELLPKEKQVIENAYDDGFENYRDASIGSDDDIIESQDYYNNKFKND